MSSPPRNVLVIGLGLFGGGVAAARYFASKGARVTVTDLRGPDVLAPSLAALEGLPVESVLGEHRREDVLAADLVVRSPAVPRTSPFIALAIEQGTPVETEMNLFLRHCRARTVVGITGSNGKTTTTAMTGAILEHAARADAPGRLAGRRVWIGGNIGRPLLTHVDEIGEDDVVVLELSSFQLEDARDVGRSPGIAVVTNLTPNHLDRHGTFEEYARAKEAIYEFQDESGWLVLNAADDVSKRWADRARGRVARFDRERAGDASGCGVWVEAGGDHARARLGQGPGDGGDAEEVTLFATSALSVPGRHNLENALAASAAALLAGAEPGDVEPALAAFRGVPHRLELVATVDGRRFYNDSIATSPEAAAVSLAAVVGPIVLLAGGSDKGLPYGPLARAVAERGARVVLFGATRDRIAEALVAELGAVAPRPTIVETLDEAFAAAVGQVEDGGAVLLAPACASFDQFRNFEARGQRFRDLAREHAEANQR